MLAQSKIKVTPTNYEVVRLLYINLVYGGTPQNILLIGIGYSRELINQLTFAGELDDISECVDSKGYEINPNVARDTVRGYCIENFEPNTIVHSITLDADSDNLSMTEMNGNVNSRNLLKKMKEKC